MKQSSNQTMKGRFENQYPLDAREREIKEILHFVTKGQSCQLISVPGAGRSTVLRLLAYNEKLREHHFKQLSHESYLFVYINFAEIPSFETAELYKALFLTILASIRELGPKKEPETSIGKEIYSIFKEAVSLNDPLVLSQALKRAMQTMQQSNNATIVFLFDRFSEFADRTTGEFFSTLRSLRAASSGKLAVVLSTHRPLEDLLPSNHWGDFYEFFVGNHVWLTMHDKVATDFRISVLEKEYGKTLPPRTKKELIKITGGHGKLVKLATQIILAQSPKLPITNYLLSHILIKGSLLEIWQALTREEKQALREEKTSSLITHYQLPFPLFTEFVKRNLAEQLVPKTIRLNEKSSDIYFGDDPIEGLTAQEFRLLTYLVANPNRVIDRDDVITAVWSDTKTAAGVSDEALDQVMHRVRKKIEDEADNPKHLLTVKGRGFRFIP